MISILDGDEKGQRSSHNFTAATSSSVSPSVDQASSTSPSSSSEEKYTNPNTIPQYQDAPRILKRMSEILESTIKNEATTRQDNQKLKSEIEKIKQNITQANKQITTVNTIISKLIKQTEVLSHRETKIIETLGIFFGLFTFISTSITIYSKVTNLFAAAIFTFLIFCLMTIIIVIFDFLLNKRDQLVAVILGIILICGLFASAIASILKLSNVSLLPTENTKEFDEAVDSRLKRKYYDKKTIDELIKESIKQGVEQHIKTGE